ncbi:hypothetical protein ES704_01370 [subsurface metagenome]
MGSNLFDPNYFDNFYSGLDKSSPYICHSHENGNPFYPFLFLYMRAYSNTPLLLFIKLETCNSKLNTCYILLITYYCILLYTSLCCYSSKEKLSKSYQIVIHIDLCFGLTNSSYHLYNFHFNY